MYNPKQIDCQFEKNKIIDNLSEQLEKRLE